MGYSLFLLSLFCLIDILCYLSSVKIIFEEKIRSHIPCESASHYVVSKAPLLKIRQKLLLFLNEKIKHALSKFDKLMIVLLFFPENRL